VLTCVYIYIYFLNSFLLKSEYKIIYIYIYIYLLNPFLQKSKYKILKKRTKIHCGCVYKITASPRSSLTFNSGLVTATGSIFPSLFLSWRTLKTNCSERSVKNNGEYAERLRGGGREPVGSGSKEMVVERDHHSEESPSESFDFNYNTFS
jgi:hypothetical protein